ncbi:MAG: di-trans,poly-cis-decaprenylcistransferase [Candidatus Aenigmarchaeota archaeon]|nr:di-trans,poly-cis-decaprenylcistransferase [Candidatus Aenigmarchaeota archaeon]
MNALKHIGVIMDGNRRLAKRLMKNPWKGHEYGANKVKDFLKWCHELGIKCITLYAFSIQNFNRPKREFNYLMKLFEREFLDICNKNHEAHKYKVRIKALGRINLLPKKVQMAIKKAEQATKNYNKFLLNFAIAYGGQEEIVDAIKKIALKVKKGLIKPASINESLVKKSLYTNGQPYPDLIIRTGGEKRVSNFMLWQGAYSELYFIDKMWPEITKRDFMKAIKDFEKRQRRFGK